MKLDITSVDSIEFDDDPQSGAVIIECRTSKGESVELTIRASELPNVLTAMTLAHARLFGEKPH